MPIEDLSLTTSASVFVVNVVVIAQARPVSAVGVVVETFLSG